MSDKNIRFALHTDYIFFDYCCDMIQIELADYVRSIMSRLGIKNPLQELRVGTCAA